MISEGQFLLGLLISLTFGLTFLFRKLDSDGGVPWLLSKLLSIFASFILILIIFPCIRWIDSNETRYYSRRGNITSIKNNDEVGGHFMLGCGSIEQTEYYYYYYKSVDGYVRGKKPVNDTFIVEDGSDKPHVEVRVSHY